MRSLVLFLLCAATGFAQTALTAGDIMARVAANQDRAERLRQEYVYEQHVHVVSKLTNGRLMREETADYEVLPMAEGIKKELRHIAGRYYANGKYVDFTTEPPSDPDGIDNSITTSFRRDLTDDKKSKDGMGRRLFPLTTEEQKEYEFKLLGEATQDERSVYRIAFTPRDKKDYGWAGEALIDKSEFEPVLVFTKMNRKLPFLVRNALGTDVPGVGFSVHYRRQADGVWFPVSFGTEFRLRVLFFMKRDISLSLANHDFRHTSVDTVIKPIPSE